MALQQEKACFQYCYKKHDDYQGKDDGSEYSADTEEKGLSDDNSDIAEFKSEDHESGSECSEGAMTHKHKDNNVRECLAMMEDLYDAPINWSSVDQIVKTDLYQSVIRKVTNYSSPDLFVRIADHHFSCHLIILQTYSTFFKNCEYGMTVYLPGDKVPYETFPIVYDWMLQHGDNHEQLLTRRNILDVLGASRYLGIYELEEQCWAFIDSVDVFSEETALLLYIEAMARENKTVMQLMLPRISLAFLSLANSDDFDTLPLEAVCALLKSNFVSVHNEMEIFKAAVKWLSFDWENRKNMVGEVMKCVRFGFMEPHQLIQLLRSQKDETVRTITQTPIVTRLIKEGQEYAVVRCTFANSPQQYYTEMKSLGLKAPEQRNWISLDNKYTVLERLMRSLTEIEGSNGLSSMFTINQNGVQISHLKKETCYHSDDQFKYKAACITEASYSKGAIQEYSNLASSCQSFCYKTISPDGREVNAPATEKMAIEDGNPCYNNNHGDGSQVNERQLVCQKCSHDNEHAPKEEMEPERNSRNEQQDQQQHRNRQQRPGNNLVDRAHEVTQDNRRRTSSSSSSSSRLTPGNPPVTGRPPTGRSPQRTKSPGSSPDRKTGILI